MHLKYKFIKYLLYVDKNLLHIDCLIDHSDFNIKTRKFS